jgi:hypothetical protein
MTNYRLYLAAPGCLVRVVDGDASWAAILADLSQTTTWNQDNADQTKTRDFDDDRQWGKPVREGEVRGTCPN